MAIVQGIIELFHRVIRTLQMAIRQNIPVICNDGASKENIHFDDQSIH